MMVLRRRKPRSTRAEPGATPWVPDRTAPPTAHEQRYKGKLSRKPWDYACEVSIPVLDTPDELWHTVQLLRLQSARPFISIIDTGSSREMFAQIEALRADDVEVHSFRFSAVHHPSDFPAIACDFSLSACRNQFLFLTHADVFLRRRDFLAEMLDTCCAERPAVGYQMSPRAHDGWQNMVSHTATMLHMPTMWRIGAGYSLARLCSITGAEHRPNSVTNNWPDTECLLSIILREHGIEPYLIGTENNYEPTIDENIYHARSLTAGKLYAPLHAEKAQRWADDAKAEARRNINLWTPHALR